MPAVTTRRRTAYDTPAWAEKILGPKPGPAEFDRLAAHEEARRLPGDTDPDTIDDDDVRQAFLEQATDDLHNEPSTSSGGSQDSTGGGRGDRGARDGTVVSSPPSASRWRSAIGSDASGVAGALGVDDAAGLLLGLIGYAVAVSAFRDPTSATNGVRRWFAAKFFNQTTSSAAALNTSKADQQDPAVLQALLQRAVTTTTATPVQPTPPANIGQLLRFGLAVPAPKPPAPAGAGG